MQHLQKAILGKDKFAVARGHKWVLYHLDKRTPTHLNNRNPIHNNNKPPSPLSTKMTIFFENAYPIEFAQSACHNDSLHLIVTKRI